MKTSQSFLHLAHVCQHAQTSHRLQSCQWCRTGNTTYRGGCNEGPVKQLYIQRQVSDGFGQVPYNHAPRMARTKLKQTSSSVLKDSCVPASYSHQCSSTIHKKEGKDLGIKPYSRWRWIKNQTAGLTAERFPLLKPHKLCLWPSYTAQLQGRQKHCDLPGCEVSPKSTSEEH